MRVPNLCSATTQQGSHRLLRGLAQGPKSATVVDFLQMVYEQQSAVIVMLTRTIESGSMRKARAPTAPALPDDPAKGHYLMGSGRIDCCSLDASAAIYCL